MSARRIWFLLRKLDEQDSLFFPIVVDVEEHEPVLFGASIPGLDGRLAAMGRTAEEAEHNAVAMFRDIVDLAFDKRIPLSKELGEGVPFRRVNVTFAKADEFFASFLEALTSIHETDEQEWRSIPTTALVAAAASSAVGA